MHNNNTPEIRCYYKMNLASYIDPYYETLAPSDTIEEAQLLFEQLNVTSLPIIHENEYLGILMEEDLETELDTEKHISTLKFYFPRPHLEHSNHVIDAIAQISDLNLSQIPMLSLDGKYEGCLSIQKVVEIFGTFNCFSEPGGILELITTANHFSPAEITRVAESEGVYVLMMASHFEQNDSQVRITLKLTTEKVAGLASIYEHYNYKVPNVYNDEDYFNLMRDRWENLMNIWKDQQ